MASNPSRSKKRGRNEAKEPLGSLEFAAALNGDDPRTILNVLKRFNKTVRRERKLALSSTVVPQDDEESTDSEDEEALLDQHSSKKLKEDWMEDSKSYNVPFVGTSVAKGDTGTVKKGVWPTGLLEAYLQASPLAAELTNNDSLIPPSGHIHKVLHRSKQYKASQAIHRAYLEALAELTTAFVPISILQRDFGVDPGTTEDTEAKETQYSRLASTLLKTLLEELLVLIEKEARGASKGERSTLAAPALDVIANLAGSSASAAREVVRALEGSFRGTVLHGLLTGKARVSGDEDVQEGSHVDHRRGSREACLRLCCVLLELRDTTVTSYIATPGSKERKIPPGVLFVALRKGIKGNADETRDELFSAISRLLRCIHNLLPREKLQNQPNRKAANERLVADLLSGEALENITAMASQAPPADSISNESALELARLEARKLLLPLLIDPSRSPFLSRINHADDSKLSTGSCSQQIVRAMLTLLESESMSAHKLTVTILTNTPALLIPLFRKLAIPPPLPASQFISRLALLRRIIQLGPKLSSVVGASGLVNPPQIDHLLLAIIPMGLKKQTLSKAIQNNNKLVMAETLKIMVLLLRRFEDLTNLFLAETDSPGLVQESIKSLTEAFVSRLPDPQTIFAAISKFDPYSVGHQQRANSIVCSHLYLVLETYASTLPDVMSSVSFEWTKLLPDRVEDFCAAPTAFQWRLLRTLDYVLSTQNVDAHSLTTDGLKKLTRVMLSSQPAPVYSLSRTILLRMLKRLIPTSDVEAVECLQYEMTSWLDGLSIDTLDEFCGLIDDAMKDPLQRTVMFAQAWESYGHTQPVHTLCFSPLLSVAMSNAHRYSAEFALFCCQVASRCVVFHQNPVPLCAVVCYGLSRQTSQEAASRLLEYCKSLVPQDWDESIDRRALFGAMASSMFTDDSFLRGLDDVTATHLSILSETKEDLPATRCCLHSIAVHETDQHFKSLRALLPLCAQRGEGAEIFFRHPVFKAGLVPFAELSFAYCISLSSPLKARKTHSNIGLLGHVVEDLCGKLRDTTGPELPSTMVQTILHIFLLSSLGPTVFTSRVTTELLLLSCRVIDDNEFPRHKVEMLMSVSYHFFRNAPLVTSNVLLKTWLQMTDLIPERLSPVVVDLVLLLEKQLCLTFAKTNASHEPAFLYGLLSEEPVDDIMKACFTSRAALLDLESSKESEDCCFLVALLENDIDRFGPPFLSQMTKVSSNLLQKGLLDSSCAAAATCRELRGSKMFLDVLQPVIDRFVASEASFLVNGSLEPIIDSLYSSVEVLTTRQLEQISEVFCTVLTSKSTSKNLLGKHIALSIKLATIEQTFAGQTTLASAVFLFLLQRIHRMLKKLGRELSSPSDIASFAKIADLTLDFIEGARLWDTGTLSSQDSLNVFSSALKACLKFGISHGHTDDPAMSVAYKSLRLIRAMLIQAWRPMSSLHEMGLICPFLNPRRLYEMIVSHSHFEISITKDSAQDGYYSDNARLEIMRLLLSCIELSPEKIAIDQSVLKPLLSAYNAGMSPIDETLRRIMFTCFASPDHDSSIEPSMDGFNFGEGRENLLVDPESKDVWEWLIVKFDVTRVRSTLCQFPVNDRLPTTELVVGSDLGKSDEESNSSSDQESDLEMDDDSPARKDDTDTQGSASGIEKWTGHGPDTRYSPAFILPLVLALLESKMNGPEGVKHEEGKSFENRPATDGPSRSLADLVSCAQLLCDKGALSLTLATLCSNCTTLRQVAVASLRLFLVAFESEEARNLTTWRERPQLAMLVNAVQRGLVIQRSELMARAGDQENAAFLKASVPRVSPLSAIFLARAALILSKPGDPMFGPINRYFLKDETNHGAFLELNRLPAFISLFCSSSDEPGQARRERMWALQLLKDGYLDESCHRTVAACHAPELLLTCFDGLVARSDDGNHDHERILILETLSNILRRGGRRAAVHLIDRIGLLSWLRSQLVSFPSSKLLPTLASRIAFTRLVATAAERSAQVEETGEIGKYESAALLDQMLSLYLDSQDSDLPRQSPGDDSYVTTFCDAVAALGTMQQVGVDSDQADGLSPGNAAKLLKILPSSLIPKVLPPLCACPTRAVSKDTQDEAAKFCVVLIETMLNGNLGLNVDPCIALNCISHLIGQCNSLSVDTLESLMKTFLCSRQSFFQSKRTRTVWFDCLDTLVSKASSQESELMQIAEKTLLAR